MADDLRQSALDYHRNPRPGKIEISATKPLANQRDLALAYSPGVAVPCEMIAEDPGCAAEFTDRGNLVAVVTNGTAVLGLGDIGPLAAKPVMEGKAVLFKNFAGIDVFDIEIEEKDPGRLVDIIASLDPTFGVINLDDIKAPECFEVEERLRKRLTIPVFHDDQHGTAIITAAAILNALKLLGKRIEDVKLVASGAGAAAIACLKLLVSMGMCRENIVITDRGGVVYVGRKGGIDSHKAEFANKTGHRTLADAIGGADIFLGLSGPGVLTAEMVKSMASSPLILALANPTPEIMPEEAKAARQDAIIATGRSDYPNQVNNVLCFPYIFRGALDVGATTITEEMKIACVEALAGMAQVEASDLVVAAYGGEPLKFGPDYLIPKPFDPRLIAALAPAVARAAMESGVASRPIVDLDAYGEELNRYVFKSVLLMRPVFERARQQPKRLVYAEGEEPRVLQAVQTVVDENLAQPVLIGRPRVIEARIERLGLRLEIERNVEVVNPESDPRFREYSNTYHQLMKRKGVSPEDARTVMRTQSTAIAAVMLHRGEADALLCGASGRYPVHVRFLSDLIGLQDGHEIVAGLNVLVLNNGTYFLADTQVNNEPDAQEIAEITLLAVEQVRRFGIEPKVALVSHSNFGSSHAPGAAKMRDALEFIVRRAPDLEVDGEMHADAALLDDIRDKVFPQSRLKGEANVLIMPNLDSAHIALNLLNVLSDAVTVGPILLGLRQPAHVLNPSSSVRRIVNMSALAAAEAQLMSMSAQLMLPT